VTGSLIGRMRRHQHDIDELDKLARGRFRVRKGRSSACFIGVSHW
jgi:hypothetical protein